MRTAHGSIPVIFAMPSEYDIQLKLDGENSVITYRETYGDDTPEEVVKRTVDIIKLLQPSLNVELLSPRVAVVKFVGSEVSVVNAVGSEFDKLRESVGYMVFPIPNSRPIPY